MVKFGPNFAEEIEAAGLMGLPFSWDVETGKVWAERLTPEQRAKLDAVIAAHEAKPAALDIKREAAKRIERHFPDFKQRNALAAWLKMAAKYGVDVDVWPPEAREAAAIDLWEWVDRVRAKSNDLESSRPADFPDPKHWPRVPRG